MLICDCVVKRVLLVQLTVLKRGRKLSGKEQTVQYVHNKKEWLASSRLGGVGKQLLEAIWDVLLRSKKGEHAVFKGDRFSELGCNIDFILDGSSDIMLSACSFILLWSLERYKQELG